MTSSGRAARDDLIQGFRGKVGICNVEELFNFEKGPRLSKTNSSISLLSFNIERHDHCP